MIDKNSVFSKWSLYNFDKTDPERLHLWEEYSLKALEILPQNNLIITANTGSGKTFIAFMIIEALNARTLFLTPSRILCFQHQEKISILSIITPAKHQKIVTKNETNMKINPFRMISYDTHFNVFFKLMLSPFWKVLKIA